MERLLCDYLPGEYSDQRQFAVAVPCRFKRQPAFMCLLAGDEMTSATSADTLPRSYLHTPLFRLAEWRSREGFPFPESISSNFVHSEFDATRRPPMRLTIGLVSELLYYSLR